jgi:hypothetical protein
MTDSVTPASRQLAQQVRLVIHRLNVFYDLQELDFSDPHVMHQGMAILVADTVRFLALSIPI